MAVSTLFESEIVDGVEDTPIFVGQFNDKTVEVYTRDYEDEQSTCEIYVGAGEGGVLEAAKTLMAFIESGTPEDYGAKFSDDDNTVIEISLGGEPWGEVYVEGEIDGLKAVVAEVEISDAELDYLQTNGVLPDPDAFGDLGIEMDPEDDFWEGE